MEDGANLPHLKERLRGMNNLRTLYLHGPQVTDGDLKCLAELSNLHTLHLRGTQITEAANTKSIPRHGSLWYPIYGVD